MFCPYFVYIHFLCVLWQHSNCIHFCSYYCVFSDSDDVCFDDQTFDFVLDDLFEIIFWWWMAMVTERIYFFLIWFFWCWRCWFLFYGWWWACSFDCPMSFLVMWGLTVSIVSFLVLLNCKWLWLDLEFVHTYSVKLTFLFYFFCCVVLRKTDLSKGTLFLIYKSSFSLFNVCRYFLPVCVKVPKKYCVSGLATCKSNAYGCRWIFLGFVENIRSLSSILSIVMLLTLGRHVAGTVERLIAGVMPYYQRWFDFQLINLIVYWLLRRSLPHRQCCNCT